MIGIDLRFFDGKYQGGVYNICISMIKSFNSQNDYLTIPVRSNKIRELLIKSGVSNQNNIIVKPLRLPYLIETFLFGYLLFNKSIEIIIWPYYCCPLILKGNKKNILGLWDITPVTDPSSYNFSNRLIFPFLMRISAYRCNKVLACSHYDCYQINTRLTTKYPALYFPLPINKEEIKINYKQSYIKEKTHKDKENKIIKIINYGSIYDRRMIPFLLKTLDSLKCDYGFEPILYLIGKDSTKDKNIDKISSQQSFKVKRFPYMMERELNELIRSSDLGVCLSNQDGTSYILLEYALKLIPVITTHLMEKEIGSHCISIKNLSNHLSLSKKIQEFFSQPNYYRDELKRKAHDYVIKNFPDEVDTKICNLITD